MRNPSPVRTQMPALSMWQIIPGTGCSLMQSAASPAPSGSFCSAADRQILRVFVPMWVKALGQGFRPLTRRKDGKIVEQGKHEELLQKGGYYHDLYSKQFQQEEMHSRLSGESA